MRNGFRNVGCSEPEVTHVLKLKTAGYAETSVNTRCNVSQLRIPEFHVEEGSSRFLSTGKHPQETWYHKS